MSHFLDRLFFFKNGHQPFAGKHGVIGAAAGCAVGHHMAKKQEKQEQQQAQAQANAQAQQSQQQAERLAAHHENADRSDGLPVNRLWGPNLGRKFAQTFCDCNQIDVFG